MHTDKETEADNAIDKKLGQSRGDYITSALKELYERVEELETENRQIREFITNTNNYRRKYDTGFKAEG